MENEEIKLWSPTTIGVTAFFLGFPGGALLATINADRMGDAENKRKYIMNGVLYVVAFVFFRVFLSFSFSFIFLFCLLTMFFHLFFLLLFLFQG